jgi:hypothetical protein
VIVLLLVWFDLYFVDWLIDSFHHWSLIDWFVRENELIWLIDWLRKEKEVGKCKLKQASEWQWEGLLVDLFVVTINWNSSSSSSNLNDWLNEWKIELISTSKTNQASIQVADYWNNKQTNKQLTHWLSVVISWLIDWKLIGKRSDIKMRLISFHFLLAFFDLWLIDWDWLIWWWFSNLTLSFFLSLTLT